MRKDLELYRSNLKKMDQLLKVIEDVLEASRKKREKREQAQENKDVIKYQFIKRLSS